jgi:hypothetical protein
MANHVHSVFRPNLHVDDINRSIDGGKLSYTTEEQTLGGIMKSLKGYTARMANESLAAPDSFGRLRATIIRLGVMRSYNG